MPASEVLRPMGSYELVLHAAVRLHAHPLRVLRAHTPWRQPPGIQQSVLWAGGHQ